MKTIGVVIKVILMVIYVTILLALFYFLGRVQTAMTTEVDDYICSTKDVTFYKTVLSDCAPKYLNEDNKR